MTWLGKNQWFTGGQPDNVGQTFFCGFCYISTTKEPAEPCNLVSGLQSWSVSILRSNPAGFYRCLFWEVCRARMAVLGLLNDLAW